MLGRTRLTSVAMLVLTLLGVCCAPTIGDGTGTAVERAPARSITATKRIMVATSLETDLRPTAPARFPVLLVHTGLVTLSDQRRLRPMLADEVPSLENGRWKLLPDGRMETSWHIRDSARWHDGTPFTTGDLLFTLQVGRDPEMSAFSSQAFSFIDEGRALDPQSLTVTWKEPFN